MAFIPLPGGIKVEVSWETGSGIAVCIHWLQKAAAGTVTSTDLSNGISLLDTWRTALRPLQPAGVIIAGIRATDWSVPDGATQFNVPSANIAGTNVSPQLPLNVAVCATHYTGLTGRSRRGRNYIPGLGESVVSVGDIVLAGMRTTIINAYQALTLAAIGVSIPFVVASFRANNLPRITGLGTVILQTAVDQYSDSQRRRLAGRGA